MSSDSRESTWRVMSEYENAIEVRCDYLGRAWFETDGLCDFRAKQRLRWRPDMGESGNPTAAFSRPWGGTRVIALAPGRNCGAV